MCFTVQHKVVPLVDLCEFQTLNLFLIVSGFLVILFMERFSRNRECCKQRNLWSNQRHTVLFSWVFDPQKSICYRLLQTDLMSVVKYWSLKEYIGDLWNFMNSFITQDYINKDLKYLYWSTTIMPLYLSFVFLIN